jgi:deoxyribodipyrimidine photo-lyase
VARFQNAQTRAHLERAGIQPERCLPLNDAPVREGRFVLYWMQAAQRAVCNHALEYAIAQADALDVPVVALFALTPSYPGANLRHYRFLLQGLAETQEALAARGVLLVARIGEPAAVVSQEAVEARLLVTDRSYMRTPRAWRGTVAGAVRCRMVQVETDAVVPVDTVSRKEEYAARTIRPKIHRHLDRFLVPLAETRPRRDSLGLRLKGESLADFESLEARLGAGGAAEPVDAFRGGLTEARTRLQRFLDTGLSAYESAGDDPARDRTSRLSPYLHFGQISPLEVVLAAQAHGGDGAAPFLEQLVVRRELAFNYTQRNPRYDHYLSLPDWARGTLRAHAADDRPYRYAFEEFETASTHDPYWNAAQRQLLREGWMHNRMRMYWGKKILEWSDSPQTAWSTALALNDTYQLDGRGPNGSAGVAWCFGKHDRPWPERPVFGKVRSMAASGLKRKFDVEAYVRRYG